MPGQFSDVGSRLALQAVSGQAATSSRATYLALLLAEPTDSNTAGTISISEYGATGYARQTIGWSAPTASALTATITALATTTSSTTGISVSSGAATGTVTQPFNTVTYTTAAAHNLVVGQIISITGFTSTGFNLTSQTVTAVPSATTFQVSNVLASGASTGTGTLTSTGPVTVTYTTSAAHGFVAGQAVNISGIVYTAAATVGNPNASSINILAVPSTTTFTVSYPYPVVRTSGGTAQVGVSISGPTVAVTFGAFTAATGATITHAALVSAATGTTGDLVAWWALDTPRTPAVNDSVTIAIGQLSLYLN